MVKIWVLGNYRVFMMVAVTSSPGPDEQNQWQKPDVLNSRVVHLTNATICLKVMTKKVLKSGMTHLTNCLA